MFRRRPIFRRRMIRQLSAMESGPRQMLMRANQLKDVGKYSEAADIFERLGKGAQNRGMLNRAPHLYIQAAHCRLLAKQIKPGIDLMWQGFHLLEKTSRWRAIIQNGKASVEELKKLGQTEAAEKLQAWLDQVVKDHPETLTTPPGLSAEKRPLKLPSKCPFCGASIHSNQAEWLDEFTIECLYCGSSIRGED